MPSHLFFLRDICLLEWALPMPWSSFSAIVAEPSNDKKFGIESRRVSEYPKLLVTLQVGEFVQSWQIWNEKPLWCGSLLVFTEKKPETFELYLFWVVKTSRHYSALFHHHPPRLWFLNSRWLTFYSCGKRGLAFYNFTRLRRSRRDPYRNSCLQKAGVKKRWESIKTPSQNVPFLLSFLYGLFKIIYRTMITS